jgi:hypothetical protein
MHYTSLHVQPCFLCLLLPPAASAIGALNDVVQEKDKDQEADGAGAVDKSGDKGTFGSAWGPKLGPPACARQTSPSYITAQHVVLNSPVVVF